MKNKIIFTIFMFLALGGALILLNQNQDTRKSAAFANTSLELKPSENNNLNVGDKFSIHLFYTTDGGAKLYNVDTTICYGPEVELITFESMGNTNLGYGGPMITDASSSSETKICKRVIMLKEASKITLAETTGELVDLKFNALATGIGTITIEKDKSTATGENVNSETDKWILVNQVAGSTYEIKETALTGDEPILNYKVSFAYVKAGGAKCVVDWPLQVIAMGNGESKVYTNVIPSDKSEVGGKVVFQGSLPLVGFTQTDKVAVFIKGPKHLQMKYAIQNQSAPYTQAGGALTLTKLATSSTIYDFSAYPMLAGDVVSPDSGSQDGWINGVDYSYIKMKADLHETVAEGVNLKGDLDGNCQVNSNDVNELKISLEKKQEELY